MPFSFFLLVPGSGLILPFYLFFFPNAIPSAFVFDYKYQKYIENLEMNQN
jgi:hypothetical protein